MNDAEKIFNSSLEATSLILTLGSKYAQNIQDIADALIECLKCKGTIYIAGNGGSAADAQHFAAELTGRYKKERPPYSCIALTTDTSTLTAIANDYGYENVFARQLAAHLKKNDVVILLSTSGTSENIIRAAKETIDNNIVISLTGTPKNRPGALLNENVSEYSTLSLEVPSKNTARVQEAHMWMLHVLAEMIDEMI